MASEEEYIDAVSQLPEPYRKRAIDNLRSLPRYHEISSPMSATGAIMNGFMWSETPEGMRFWDALYFRLCCENPIPPPVSFPIPWPAK
jgi:hypothetical protein